MAILEQVYASAGPGVIILTPELTCQSRVDPIRICSVFEGHVAGGTITASISAFN
jgi:hypothetical protein